MNQLVYNEEIKSHDSHAIFQRNLMQIFSSKNLQKIFPRKFAKISPGPKIFHEISLKFH